MELKSRMKRRNRHKDFLIITLFIECSLILCSLQTVRANFSGTLIETINPSENFILNGSITEGYFHVFWDVQVGESVDVLFLNEINYQAFNESQGYEIILQELNSTSDSFTYNVEVVGYYYVIFNNSNLNPIRIIIAYNEFHVDPMELPEFYLFMIIGAIIAVPASLILSYIIKREKKK